MRFGREVNHCNLVLPVFFALPSRYATGVIPAHVPVADNTEGCVGQFACSACAGVTLSSRIPIRQGRRCG